MLKKVGAISNVKNPIMVSLSLLDAQLKGTLSMGRYKNESIINIFKYSIYNVYMKSCTMYACR